MRSFTDAAGVEWIVYLTIPSNTSERRGQHLADEYRSGWLVFESAMEKRRFAPVPAEWAHLSTQALAALCDASTPQPAHRRGATTRAVGDLPVTAAPEPPRSPTTGAPRPEELQNELQHVSTKLDDTLERVCDARAGDDSVDRLDTGELIRVEETLSIAAEMAKQAVTLRRKLRTSASRGDGAGTEPDTDERDRPR